LKNVQSSISMLLFSSFLKNILQLIFTIRSIVWNSLPFLKIALSVPSFQTVTRRKTLFIYLFILFILFIKTNKILPCQEILLKPFEFFLHFHLKHLTFQENLKFDLEGEEKEKK